ncbi:MAG: LPS-assembly protein LptD, partial [Desulfosalsimonas sp.]
SDATFYYNHMQRRGEKLGFEYRYMLSEDSKGTLMADGFKDRKVDDGSEDSTEDWGYDDDNVIRPNDDRYWIRMKANQEIIGGATAHLDLDIVSDQDYLREFSGGYMGHDSTDSYFGSEFGRDIDDENDPVRTNRLNINRTWSYQSINADLVWYDNVIKRRLKDEDDTLQQVPRIQYNALKQPFFGDITGGLFFGSLDSGYTYFYRRDEPADTDKGHTGHRMDIHPRVYLPLRAGRFFSFEPSVGFRQTAWYIDADRQFHGPEKDRYLHRELYDIEADLSTDINRIFSVDRGGVEKIKHVVIPRLSYGFIPETDQSEYPEFDQTDRIEAQNRVALSLTHLFTSKAAKPGNNGDNNNGYTYNRFARLFIEQAYDFRQKSDPEKAWMPLLAELDLTPADLITLRADGTWNHANNELDTGNLSLRLYDDRGDELRAEYRYTRREDRDSVKSIDLYAKTPITKSLTLFGNYERNLETNTDIEKGLGVRYQSQCWAIEVAWQDEEDDTRYMAMVELMGLGGFGDTLENR